MSPRDPLAPPSAADATSNATLRTLSILKRASRERVQKSDAQRSIDRDFLLRIIRERLASLTSGRA